jgi:hypothetical protein
MARLFEALRGRGILDWVLVLGGTLLLFEATVLLGALLLHLVDYRIEYRVLWNICTGFSLPWHLASLWASAQHTAIRSPTSYCPYPLYWGPTYERTRAPEPVLELE